MFHYFCLIFDPFLLFQGFEDCLVFDELMDKFNNNLSKCPFSVGHGLGQVTNGETTYDPGM